MRSRIVALAALSLAVLLIAGCTDDEAQKSITQLKGDNAKLQEQVDSLKGRLEEVHTATNFDAVIEQKVNARLKVIEEEQRQKTDTNTKTINDFVESSRAKFDEYNSAMKAQMGDKDTPGFIEEHLRNQITAQAQVEREEREKLKVDILRYIESQLKDIYPFAYKKQRANDRKVSDNAELIP